MSAQGPDFFSIDTYVPIEELGTVLKVSDDSQLTELSAAYWEDKETVKDELATFFPFNRYFNREWDGIKDGLAQVCLNGRLIVFRGVNQSAPAFENLRAIIELIVSLYTSEHPPTGRVVIVLEPFGGTSLQLSQATFPVQKLQLPPHQSVQNIYSIQVSGKRNHTYYVGLALKVFQRREWYAMLELSGLGNAIPSIVSIAEILKRYKVATVQKIETSLVELTDGEGSRTLQKAKIVILMTKIASIPDLPDDPDSLGDQVVSDSI